MGWNEVELVRPTDPLLGFLPAQPHFYFVHSYYVEPTDPSCVVLVSDYGVRFTAAVRVGSVFACQFHPEKSQQLGLALLTAFVNAS
jgi:glutamine amidotransferase